MFIDTSDALNLMAFDAATGDIRWQFFTGGWTWAQPMIDDNTVYIGAISAFPYYFEGIDLERGFFAVDATTGQQKWCVDLPAVKGYVTGGLICDICRSTRCCLCGQSRWHDSRHQAIVRISPARWPVRVCIG